MFSLVSGLRSSNACRNVSQQQRPDPACRTATTDSWNNFDLYFQKTFAKVPDERLMKKWSLTVLMKMFPGGSATSARVKQAK